MKELTKRQERLARQGNPKALDLMREYMMFYYDLFEAERALGEAAANSKLDAYAAKYKSAAEVIAQYESPKLQATSNEVVVRHAVIRSPELCDSNEDWIQKYVPKDLRDKPPTEIDGEVVASATAASAPPTPQPSSTAVELCDPNSFQLQVIKNRYFSLRRINNPSRP